MVKVMKKVSENYVINAKMARKGGKEVKVFDVTKGGSMGFLDPESEWGDIEIEGMEEKSLTLLGMWEGLKMFSGSKKVSTMYFERKNLVGKLRSKRNVKGIMWGDELIKYDEAIEKVFKPRYKKEVRERFGKVIEGMKKAAEQYDVVLLDYSEEKRKTPVSYVEILKEMIES